jgi:hypothetical protein
MLAMVVRLIMVPWLRALRDNRADMTLSNGCRPLSAQCTTTHALITREMRMRCWRRVRRETVGCRTSAPTLVFSFRVRGLELHRPRLPFAVFEEELAFA